MLLFEKAIVRPITRIIKRKIKTASRCKNEHHGITFRYLHL